ncbi:MAG: hydrogenase expression/formation C-terminal domain-containing protein [Pseudomonadota bacterium]
MQKLQDIEVRTEAPFGPDPDHGNATPILHEVLHALQRLLSEGETTTIDLRSIPFGPGDEQQLLKILGRGEVDVQLDALGMSEIWESRYAGVWLVDHKNQAGERIALQIEVTRVPEILQAQSEDISESIARLDDQLKTAAGSPDAGGPNG